jgi:large subunit ribosomal protein L23
MRDAYDVIYEPVITEKTSDQMEIDTVYTFIVNKHANKIEIGRAIEQIWDVTVKGVRTMRYAGKARKSHMGRMSKSPRTGRRAAFKKAVVQLSEGDHIELYEAG